MSRTNYERQKIGIEIRRLRQEQDMTLDDLATASHISASHLSRIERGQTLPSFTVLANIASTLGVSLDVFVQLEEEVTGLDEELTTQLSSLGLSEQAITEILGLSVDTRRQLNGLIAKMNG